MSRLNTLFILTECAAALLAVIIMASTGASLRALADLNRARGTVDPLGCDLYREGAEPDRCARDHWAN